MHYADLNNDNSFMWKFFFAILERIFSRFITELPKTFGDQYYVPFCILRSSESYSVFSFIADCMNEKCAISIYLFTNT